MALFGRQPLSILQTILRVMGRDPRRGNTPAELNQTFDWDWEERRDIYSRWESLYANSIYGDQKDGGYKEIILRDEISSEDTTLPLHGFYNPVGIVADNYQNLFRGQFGQAIKIAPKVEITGEVKPLNNKIVDPIGRIIRWSNLNSQKEQLQYYGALLGTVGLRIESPNTDADGKELAPEKKRVRIRPVHPSEIVDFNEDADGNITDVLLEYSQVEGTLGEGRDDEATTYREYLSKEMFIKFREDKKIFEGDNALGVCPFVLLRHKNIGAQFGVPAHFGSEGIIHQVNWLITRTGISVDRHVFAKWFAAASGSRPESFDLGDTSVAYVQMSPGDTAPKLEAIVAKLDFIGIERLLIFFIAHLRQRQPELTLASLESLSGQSGETIAKLLIPIEERLFVARGHYEYALIRAMQIGMSYGVLNGMWDLGAGIGNVQAADKSYQDGFEDFQFNERSALPETVFDKINRAKADSAGDLAKSEVAAKQDGMVPRQQQMRILGHSESEIATMIQQLRTQDVAENPPDTTP